MSSKLEATYYLILDVAYVYAIRVCVYIYIYTPILPAEADRESEGQEAWELGGRAGRAGTGGWAGAGKGGRRRVPPGTSSPTPLRDFKRVTQSGFESTPASRLAWYLSIETYFGECFLLLLFCILG